jgi:ribosomal RNA-processing protein 7
MPPKTKPKIPQTIADLLVLPLSLPLQKALPNPTATHYLYLRPDAPKTPNPDTPRSLFLANVPVDADETNLRSLFKDLCGAIVERVDFEVDDGQRENVLVSLGIGSDTAAGKAGSSVVALGEPTGGGVLGKRKRREDKEMVELEEDLRLPATWGQWLRKSGSGAVVVFVDAASMQRAFRECRRVVREGGAVEWNGAEGLGEKRECSFHVVHWVEMLMS